MDRTERDVPTVLAIVNSKSRPNVKYEIRRSMDGADVYCTCPAWRFSKSRPRNCKHLIGFFERKVARAAAAKVA
jgi:hypothetical protein